MKVYKITCWFNHYWYEYLFAKPFSFTALICRYKGHPCGSIYYNPNGLEPNRHCKNCGDLIN